MPWKFVADDVEGEALTAAKAREFMTESGIKVFDETEVNKIVSRRVNERKNELSTELEDIKTERDDLKTKYEDAKKKSGVDKENFISKTEHERLYGDLKKQYDAKEKAEQVMQKRMIDSEVKSHAAEWSVAPDAVVKLIGTNMKIDQDGKIYPVDENGERLSYSVDGGSMFHDVKSYVNDFGKKPENSYLVKPSGNSGAGTKPGDKGGNNNGTKPTIEQQADMPIESYAAGWNKGDFR